VLFFEFSYEKKSMLVIIKKAQVVFMWINTEIFALFAEKHELLIELKQLIRFIDESLILTRVIFMNTF